MEDNFYDQLQRGELPEVKTQILLDMNQIGLIVAMIVLAILIIVFAVKAF